MTSEQINEILAAKRIPLTFKKALSHYYLAIVMGPLGCFFVFEYIWNVRISGDEFILVFGILIIFFSSYLVLFSGKKQLRLQKIQFRFLDDESAYLKAKCIFAYYHWGILEENGTNYIKALRADTNIAFNSLKGRLASMSGFVSWQGRAVSVFIEHGYIYINSLYHPVSQADFFGTNARNIRLFKKRIFELDSHQQQPSEKSKDAQVTVKYIKVGIIAAVIFLTAFLIYSQISKTEGGFEMVDGVAVSEDILKYRKCMERFYSMESMALEVYQLDEDTPKEEMLAEIKNRGLYYWNENIILLNNLEKLNLPEHLHKKNKILLKYCDLRIKGYGLLYKAIEEDTDIYSAQIENNDLLIEKIFAEIKELNKSNGK